MAAADYVTLPVVKEALGKASVDDRDDLIEAAITAASRMIDQRTGRRFYVDAAASARQYNPDGRLLHDRYRVSILIDDVSTATGMVVETGSATSAWTAVPTFDTGPENAAAWDRPVTSVRFPYGWVPVFYPWEYVRVTAKWGWPQVPAEIVQAATLQAARLYRRKDSPQGILASPEWGGMHVSRCDPDVEALIAPYARPGFA